MRQGMVASCVFHAVVILLAMFGLPHIMPDPPQVEDAVIVELAPIAEKTNAPPKQQAQPKAEDKPAEPEKQEAPPVPEPKPEPPQPKPEPPPPPPPPAPPPPPTPTPPPPKPEPPKPEPAPAPAPKPEPPKPPPPPKPEPPKEQPKKKDDFDAMMNSALNTLAKPKPQTSSPAPAPQPQNTPAASKVTSNSSNWDPTQPISASEKDFIASHYNRCWDFDAGAKGASSMIINMRVKLNADGSVMSAEIDKNARYFSESAYQAAADRARRDILNCDKLQIPAGKYDSWKEFNLTFDPRNKGL